MNSRGIETTTYLAVDLLFYEWLRRAVVTAGYLPDIKLYSNNAPAWNNARATLRGSLPTPQLIDIYGVDTWKGRAELTPSRFVIDRVDKASGNIGGFPESFYEKKDNGGIVTYDKYAMPAKTSELMYNVRLITDNLEYAYVMEDIVMQVFGERKYISTITPQGNESGLLVLVEGGAAVDVSTTDNREILYTFKVCDLWLERPTLIQAGIVPMTSVEAGIFDITTGGKYLGVTITENNITDN